jgi:hypothetical protein
LTFGSIKNLIGWQRKLPTTPVSLFAGLIWISVKSLSASGILMPVSLSSRPLAAHSVSNTAATQAQWTAKSK